MIAKRLIAKAKDTGHGIALEDFKGIRDRTRFRRQQRARRGNWAFQQLRAFVEYKAAMAGVPVVLVNPAHKSQTCSNCGHIAQANRPSQAEFRCVICKHTDHADVNAARNIASRAKAAVNRPKVSEPHQDILAA